jgi:parallel beta-helix repeat protein
MCKKNNMFFTLRPTWLFLLLAFSWACAPSSSNEEPRTGGISGTVRDGQTLLPLAGAAVRVKGTTFSQQTGVSGSYSFTGLEEGSRTITVSCPDYRDEEQVIAVTAGATAVADFSLFPAQGGPAYFVALAGDDSDPGTLEKPWRTVQKAADSAQAGGTVYIRAGIYREKVRFNVSGSTAAGSITFRPYGAEAAVIDGTNIPGRNLLLLENRDYIKIIGLELRNNLKCDFAAAIWIRGRGDHLEIRGCRIHEIRGRDAMGIAVYGDNRSASIKRLVIAENEIFNCDPAWSEAVALNGNVEDFEIRDNLVHDVNNIGIVCIGGERTCPDPALDMARLGIVAGNTVYRARSSYEDGYAAGIYIDGGSNIVLERNRVFNCDLGIEVGCENKGCVATGNVARDNLVYGNDKAGLVFGGYDYPRTGAVKKCRFLNNTVFHNDTLKVGNGELMVQYVIGCEVRNNVIVALPGNYLMTSTAPVGGNNHFNYNLWFSSSGGSSIRIEWNGELFRRFGDYQQGSGQDGYSLFADPLFFDTAKNDARLQAGSPAIDSGDPAFVPAVGETDFAGAPRVTGGRVDCGAYEFLASLKPD